MMIRYLFMLCCLSCCLMRVSVASEQYWYCVKVGAHTFETEVVDTPEKRQQGMMFRQHMKDNQAMLFIFYRSHRATFWMKNTLIPLDMLFFDASGTLLEQKYNVLPCQTEQCPIYPTRSDQVQYVLEVAGGVAEQLAFSVGEKLSACED